MTPTLIWNDDPQNGGWACSNCSWKYPVPTFLSDPEAKRAYDRLAAAQFRDHICDAALPTRVVEDTSNEPSFDSRVMKLIKVGYKPKDAVDIALDEIGLEHRNDPKVMTAARNAAQVFLQKVREGRI